MESELLSNFVASYYHTLIKEPENLIKFYSKEAQIWRDSSSRLAQTINEKQELFPKTQPSDEISILDYHGLSITNGFNIIVNGILKIGNEPKPFTHQFTLQQKSNRYLIISDNLAFLPIDLTLSQYNKAIQGLQNNSGEETEKAEKPPLKIFNYAFSSTFPDINAYSDVNVIDLLKTRISIIQIESFRNLIRYRSSLCRSLESVTIKDCLNLTVIDISQCNIRNLVLYNLPKLRCISLEGNPITTFNFQLPSLETLIISHTYVSDLNPHNFPNLLNLQMLNTQIEDIHFISQLPHLQRLQCSPKTVDFNIFSSHPSLESLYIENSNILNINNNNNNNNNNCGNLKRFLYQGTSDISSLSCPHYESKSKVYHLSPENIPSRSFCSWIESTRLLFGPWGIPPVDKDDNNYSPIKVFPYRGPPIDNAITNDRIMGSIFGLALGDCLGVSAEHHSTPEAFYIFETPLDITWNWITPVLFYRGCSSDDTDQAVFIMRSLSKGYPDFCAFAREMRQWLNEGEIEHRHGQCFDCGVATYYAITSRGYLNDPIRAVKNNPKYEIKASNGSTMRTAPVGCFHFWDENEVIKNAINYAQCTHLDPRAIFGSVLVSLLISRYIQQANGLIQNVDIDETIETSIKAANAESFREEIMNHCNVQNLDILNDSHAGFVLKAISATIYSLRQNLSYTEAMEQVISMGHDGDTNAAIVGSVLGAKFGFEKIPKQLMKYLYLGNWIYKDLAKMMSAMGVQPLESPFHKLSFE